MPGIPLIDCSSGSVIWVSITSEFAPGYCVSTEMIGGSTLGNSLIPKNVRPTTPKSKITIANTVANTGLLILTDDKLILLLTDFINNHCGEYYRKILSKLHYPRIN